MAAIEVVIHGTGTGTCSLSGKEGEGLTVSFKDGTITEGFLTQKAFLSLVKMKFAKQNGKADAKPEVKPELRAELKPAPVGNGTPPPAIPVK